MKKLIIVFVIILYLIPALSGVLAAFKPSGAYVVYDASNPPSASQMADSNTTYVENSSTMAIITILTAAIIPILAVLLAIINIILAIGMQGRKAFNSNKSVTLKTILIMKLVLLPYFIALIIMWLATVILGIVPVFMYLWFFAALLAIFGYIVGSVSVCYSISRIIILKRKGAVSTNQCIIHSILQLFFIVDIIDLFYLYFKVYKDNSLLPKVISQGG